MTIFEGSAGVMLLRFSCVQGECSATSAADIARVYTIHEYLHEKNLKSKYMYIHDCSTVEYTKIMY